MITLAAVLVVAMAYMAVKTFRTSPKMSYEQEVQMMNTQSDSDTVNSIQKDLMDTDLNNLDKELQDIDSELNSVN